MAFEWVAGLFQGDNQTRGLSRDQSNGVALDNANSFYNYRLKRHSTDGDLIADPALLWYTSPYVKRRSGLGSHIGGEVGEGTANYTDVLVVVSREDWPRASPEWQATATATLQREFEQFCRRENFNRLYAHRPLGVCLVEDGGAMMRGQMLSLTRGEFVTGLIPNLYTGPVRGSYPVIGVHLNLPGIWEGYREVGRMYNDQILFTVGNHWLDNFHHPSLLQSALYRLRQYSDGSFLHIVNPDLQDQYQVTSSSQGGGASVLTLATRTGHPLAYMVLAVIDPPKVGSTGPAAPQRTSGPQNTPLPSAQQGAAYAGSTPYPAGHAQAPAGGWAGQVQGQGPYGTRRPGIAMPAAGGAGAARPRADGQYRSDSSPAIAPPMMLDEGRPNGSGGLSGTLGGKTIIPDAPSERIFTFQERGALLQKVHFAAFMLGYDVYLGPRGELGTHVEEPAATFQVRKRAVHLIAHIDSVQVDGKPIPAGVEVPIEGDVTIEVAGQKLEYRDLRACQVDGWPYVGEIRRPASSTYMLWGEDYHVGRSRECRVVLPDEPRNENIHWKPGVGDGTTIRARSGEIPKARFYTDSIMVASEHADVNLTGERPRIVCSARHCFVYVRRGESVFALHPATSEQGAKEMELDTGDEVLIGNCLFHVSYNVGEAAFTAPAPMVQMEKRPASPPAPEQGARTGAAGPTADRLVADIAAPNLQMLDRDTGPPAPGRVEAPPRVSPSSPGIYGSRSGLQDIDGATDRPPASGGATGRPPASGGETGRPPASGGATGRPPASGGETGRPPASGGATGRPPASGGATGRPPASGGANYRSMSPTDVPSREVPPPAPARGPVLDSIAGPTGLIGASAPIAARPEVFDPRPLGAVSLFATPDPGATGSNELEASAAGNAEPTADVAGWDTPDWENDTTDPPTVEMSNGTPSSSGWRGPLPAATIPDPFLSPIAADPRSHLNGAPSASVSPAGGSRAIVAVEDAQAQVELGRPLHLVLVGWVVNGEAVCGNHEAADLVIPESRIRRDQRFASRDYFRLKVRGRKGTIEILDRREVEVDGSPGAATYDDPDPHRFDVIRRDDTGARDYVVSLRLVDDPRLPDPRARFLAIDAGEPLSAPLFTRGLPRGAARTLSLGPLRLTLLFDGNSIRFSDYLASYRQGENFLTFLVQRGEGRFQTASEDGAPFSMSVGERFIVGSAVYELRTA